MSQTRWAAQAPDAGLQPEHDGQVTMRVADLADGHVVQDAEAEEAGFAAELVLQALPDDLVFALRKWGGAKNKNKTFCKEWKNYLFIIYLFAQNVSSSVLTAQFLQHMPHLVLRASGTVGWILQLERSSSESGADVGSGGDDVGVTPLVAAGSSCWKNVCFLDGLFTNSGFPPLYCSTLLYCEKHVKNRT